MTYDGQKRKIQFYNPATVDTDPSELVYVVISATPQMLDEIGGLIFASGSRFPAKEQYSNFPFNEETRQELIYIGLQLMGAAELSFDGDWSDSLDDDFHLTWEQDSTDKGLWHLHLNNPIISDGTDGREIELDKGTTYIRWRYVGDSSWINLVSLTELTGPAGADGASGADGTDGNDGADGREVDFRVSGGYIQWEYVTGDTWHNLVSLATLTGPQGPAGTDGTNGTDGADGADGADGTDVSTPPSHGMTPSDETRCSVSVAVVNYIYGVFSGALRMDSTARSEIVSGAGGIGLALGLIFPGLGAVIAAGVAGAALYATLLDIEANGYIPYFDTDVKDDLKCMLYCLLDDNGLYTEAVHDALKAQIESSTEPLYDAIASVMDKAGYKPFQWGALSAPLLAAPDCTSCDCPEDWCQTWDFTVEPGPFTPYSGSGAFGTWTSGIGWTCPGNNQLSLHCTEELSYHWVSFALNVTGSIGGANHSDVYENPSTYDTLISVGLTAGVQTTSWEGAERTGIPIISAYDGAANDFCVFTSCTIKGSHDNPFTTGESC